MRLIDALENYPALADRIPAHFWFPDERNRAAPTHACGYCAKGRSCNHDEVDRPRFWQRPLIHRRPGDRMDLVQLKIDIDREIDGLPARPRQLFHLRYRIGLDQREVMAALGLRQQSDYQACFGLHYEAMAIRLRHWFERLEAEAA